MSLRTLFLTHVMLAGVLAGCGGNSERVAARSDSGRADASISASPAVASPMAEDSDAAEPASAEGAARPTAPPPLPNEGVARPDAAGTSRNRSTPRRVTLGDIDLTGVGYDVGDREAPVVLIDFSDFGCPYCARFSTETYPTLEREYVRTGKVFFKYVPFVMGMFPHGQEAARAAECAAEQGRFWPMHDLLYAHQAEWKRAREPAVAFGAYVDSLGLDHARFGACYARGSHPRTQRANEAAHDIGVRVTPSFIVNGRPVEGALPLADFRRVLDAALLLARPH